MEELGCQVSSCCATDNASEREHDGFGVDVRMTLVESEGEVRSNEKQAWTCLIM